MGLNNLSKVTELVKLGFEPRSFHPKAWNFFCYTLLQEEKDGGVKTVDFPTL